MKSRSNLLSSIPHILPTRTLLAIDAEHDSIGSRQELSHTPRPQPGVTGGVDEMERSGEEL